MKKFQCVCHWFENSSYSKDMFCLFDKVAGVTVVTLVVVQLQPPHSIGGCPTLPSHSTHFSENILWLIFILAFCKSVLVFWCLSSSHWTHFSENILWLIPSLISVKKKLCLSHIPFHNLSSRFDWEIFLHMKNLSVLSTFVKSSGAAHSPQTNSQSKNKFLIY